MLWDYRPPHYAFPLQGLMPKSSSDAELRVHYTEIHTSGPVGSWARLASLLSSLSELYVIFERVCCALSCERTGADFT